LDVGVGIPNDKDAGLVLGKGNKGLTGYSQCRVVQSGLVFYGPGWDGAVNSLHLGPADTSKWPLWCSRRRETPIVADERNFFYL
jgi:hypothetical protein